MELRGPSLETDRHQDSSEVHTHCGSSKGIQTMPLHLLDQLNIPSPELENLIGGA